MENRTHFNDFFREIGQFGDVNTETLIAHPCRKTPRFSTIKGNEDNGNRPTGINLVQERNLLARDGIRFILDVRHDVVILDVSGLSAKRRELMEMSGEETECSNLRRDVPVLIPLHQY